MKEDQQTDAADNGFFKLALEQASAELETALEARNILDVQIHKLAELVRSLKIAMGQSVPMRFDHLRDRDTGLTESCRRILTPEGLTAQQVLSALAEYGYPILSHSQPGPSVHAVLKRLVKSGYASTFREGRVLFYRKQDRSRAPK